MQMETSARKITPGTAISSTAKFSSGRLMACQLQSVCAGCGKTSLVTELAHKTGNDLSMLHVHVDDQMDSKSLLGAYICTSVPGEFSWQPGPLAQVQHPALPCRFTQANAKYAC